MLRAARVTLNRDKNRESEGPQEHGNADGNKQEKVVTVRHDTVGVGREARIVEGRDRVENAMPDSLERTFAQSEEARNENKRNDCFNRKGSVGDALNDATNFPILRPMASARSEVMVRVPKPPT